MTVAYDSVNRSFWIVDNCSMNGVYLNGKRLEPNPKRFRLMHGDYLCIGGPTTVVREGVVYQNPLAYDVLDPHAGPAMPPPPPRAR